MGSEESNHRIALDMIIPSGEGEMANVVMLVDPLLKHFPQIHLDLLLENTQIKLIQVRSFNIN